MLYYFVGGGFLHDPKRFKQQDLADYLHCSQVAYSHYERGTRDIPTDVLIALAKFHHTTTDYILGLTYEK
ncbi:MAG: helix-turn-helix transcriptional regulator [Clostridia bacterium]|nr:helix-turn-helix transcriptional regulator [Clostridia bacterium]